MCNSLSLVAPLNQILPVFECEGRWVGAFQSRTLCSLVTYLQMKSLCYWLHKMQLLLGTSTLTVFTPASRNPRAAFHPLVITYMTFNGKNGTSVVCWFTQIASFLWWCFYFPFFLPPPLAEARGLTERRLRKFIQAIHILSALQLRITWIGAGGSVTVFLGTLIFGIQGV